MRLFDYILAHAAKQPHKTALICGKETLSYQDVVSQTRKLSMGLVKLGLESGDHLGILLDNSINFAITMLAAANLGLVVVPMDTTLGLRALHTAFVATDIKALIGWYRLIARLLEQTDIKLPIAKTRYITVGDDRKNVETGSYETLLTAQGVSAEIDKLAITAAHQGYILTMTSGSTGTPKPILFSQRTKVMRALAAQNLYNLTSADIILVGTPMHHSLAQRLTLLPLLIGGTAVILPRYTPKLWVEAVMHHQVSFTIGVSSQLEGIIRFIASTELHLDSLQTLVSSSAPISLEGKKLLKKIVGCKLHECYGASEIGIATNLSISQAEDKLHTVGTVCPDVSLQIIDNQGAPLPHGEIGEIACRTPLAFSGYYGNPKATAASYLDRYFLTGDMGMLDADGYLVLAGRKKEIIITGGINVYPKDIEEVLDAHPAVQESAVIGVADPMLGEAVLALIVPRPEVNIDQRTLERYAANQLANFQRPMAYEFIASLPRNPMGKIQKQKLIERYQNYDATRHLRAILG